MKRLSFYLNKELDKRVVEEFLNVRADGVDFSRSILKTHPQLKSAKLNVWQRKKIIGTYFDTYYRNHKKAMRRKMNQVRHKWSKYERDYVDVTENVFGGFHFPPGKYIAYVSAVNCNPRFLDSKTFQFFYKKPIADAIHTIAHELLHFIFFDFVKHELKNITKSLSPDALWKVSEIFNITILRLPQYRPFINQRYIQPYPTHRKYIFQFKAAYQRSSNIQEFIVQGVAIIKKKKRED